MDFILSPIASAFGSLLLIIYNSVGLQSYGLSLLLFTVAVRLLLLPLSIKQIRSGQRMQEIQPELARIQERYKNDKEKLNEETMKLYQEKKYNPASGCLPLVVQMPILFALFYVIRMPVTYMLDVPRIATGDLIVAAVEAGDPAIMASLANFENAKNLSFNDIKGNRLDVYNYFRQTDPYIEIKIVEFIDQNPDELQKILSAAPDRIAAYYDIIETDPAERAALDEGFSEDLQLYTRRASRLDGFNIKMWNFFNFGVQPALDWNIIRTEPDRQLPALLLLVIAVVSTFFSTKLMMPKPDPKATKSLQSGCATNSMLWMSPIMTLWFGFTTPSGLAFYWIISNVVAFSQQKLLTAHTKKDSTKKNSKKDQSVIEVQGKVLADEAQVMPEVVNPTKQKAITGGKSPYKREVVKRDKNNKKRGKNR